MQKLVFYVLMWKEQLVLKRERTPVGKVLGLVLCFHPNMKAVQSLGFSPSWSLSNVKHIYQK